MPMDLTHIELELDAVEAGGANRVLQDEPRWGGPSVFVDAEGNPLPSSPQEAETTQSIGREREAGR